MGLSAEQILTAERALVIGHRGYSARAPENTRASFRLAMDSGADLVELDYHHSKDGVPVVFHDRVLDRTTDARRKWKGRRIRIAAKTAAELQGLNAGQWFHSNFEDEKVPTLAEALELICAGSLAVVEHKSGDPKTLARILRDGNWLHQTVVISFDWRFLRELHDLEPGLMLGALGPPVRLTNGRRPIHVRRGLGARLADLLKTGAKLAVWNHRVSRRAVALAHARGLRVWIYTVDRPRLARRLLRIGVDGLITNELARVKTVLEKAGAEQTARSEKPRRFAGLARKLGRRR